MIVSLLVLIVVAVLSIPAAIVLIPWTLISKDPTALYNTANSIVRVAFRVADIQLVVTGRENFVPGQACIFMANHVSNLDPPALLSNLPGRTVVFLKRSLMSIPVLGYAFKLGEFIPVSRSGAARRRREKSGSADGPFHAGDRQ